VHTLRWKEDDMTRTKKKTLRLHRETLKALTRDALAQAAGGTHVSNNCSIDLCYEK
jgi:hypothetical protein